MTDDESQCKLYTILVVSIFVSFVLFSSFFIINTISENECLNSVNIYNEQLNHTEVNQIYNDTMEKIQK